MKKQAITMGLTLVELLIGTVLASMIMLGISTLIQQTSVSNARLNQTNSLIREGQIAQQIISGRLAEAIYVWPSGFTAGTISFNGGVTTKNTVMSDEPSSSWPLGLTTGATQTYYESGSTTEANPMRFVAMILPPTNPQYDAAGNIINCTSIKPDVTAGTTDTNAPTTTDGCYRFFAYYPMRRSYLSDPGKGLSEANRPVQDSLNDLTDRSKDRWVIMELRANLYSSTAGMWLPKYGGATTTGAGNPTLGVSSSAASWSTNIQPTYLAGRDASVLVDYVKPGSLSFRVYRPGSPNAAGQIDPTLTAAGSTQSALNTNNGRVDYTFEMERFMPGNKVSASSKSLGGSITIKNWYCPKAMVASPLAINCP